MNYNFIFTFPEVDGLNDVIYTPLEYTINGNEIIFNDGPAFPKPKDRTDFLGWEVYATDGDLELVYAPILTKNNKMRFNMANAPANQTTYTTTLYCRMKWVPTITLNCVWGNFDPKPVYPESVTAVMGKGVIGNIILGEE